MDTTDPDIVFDNNGICNHCKEAENKLRTIQFDSLNLKEKELKKIVEKLKREGKNQKYDCVIGLSGGVDSSYLAYKVKEMGLRPLAVHLDNGWNSELAVKNIENIINTLKIDLFTYVIDWEEFKALEVAYFRSGVIDLEMLSDNAIVVSIYKTMKKYNIKTFFIGTNIETESVMPQKWFFTPKYDSLNIRSIYKKFGNGVRLKTFPMLNLFEYIRFHYFKTHNSVALLNYMEYNKAKALKVLQEKVNYIPYPGKHYESRITRFYQSYILPKKYNVDKRKAHLSSLIASGQISRDEALKQLTIPLFNSELELKNEIDYFCKKLGISDIEFQKIMKSKPVSHFDFPSYYGIHRKVAKTIKKIIGRSENKN
jgi:N-acetyl sugar amidotransferase